jgi:spermidine synthase
MKFVAETGRRFDVIIVDSTDPQGPGAVLFTEEFYAGCKRCLTKGGILVTQNGVPMFQPEELTATVGKLGKLFKDATCYLAAIPTYVGGFMAMGFATDNKALRRLPERTITARYRKAGRFPTQYWTPGIHKAAFALPRFIEELVAKAKSDAKK